MPMGSRIACFRPEKTKAKNIRAAEAPSVAALKRAVAETAFAFRAKGAAINASPPQDGCAVANLGQQSQDS